MLSKRIQTISLGILIFIIAMTGVGLAGLGVVIMGTTAIEYSGKVFFSGLSMATTGMVMSLIWGVYCLKPGRARRWTGVVWGTSLVISATWAVLVLVNIFISPRDQYEDRPKDVVVKFVEAAQAGQFNTAQAYWTGRSRRDDGPIDFQVFCTEHFGTGATYEIKDIRRGKGSFHYVHLIVMDQNRKAFDGWLMLSLRPDGWKIHRDRWF